MRLPLAVLACAFLASCAGMPSRRVDAEAKKLSDQLLARSEASGATVAVIPFRSDQGRISELGRTLSLSMTEDLSTSRRFVPIEREALCAVMQEISLNTTGLTDPKTSLSLGKMSEARYLVLGTIDPTGPDSLDVRVRLIETESGRVAATASTMLPRSGNLEDLFQRTFTSSFCPSASASQAARPALPVPAQPLPRVAGVWRLGEGSGARANDSSGNGNHGTLFNSPAWIREAPGSGLVFDGVSQFVGVHDAPSLRASSQVSLEGWFNTKTLAAKDQAIVTKWWDGSVRSYALYLHFGHPFFDVAFTDSNTDHQARLYVPIQTGKWHHAAGTYDGSWVKLYLDGVLVSSEPFHGLIAPNAAPLGIGADLRSQPSDLFSGSIDDVRVLNVALTSAEVAKDYAAGARSR